MAYNTAQCLKCRIHDQVPMGTCSSLSTIANNKSNDKWRLWTFLDGKNLLQNIGWSWWVLTEFPVYSSVTLAMKWNWYVFFSFTFSYIFYHIPMEYNCETSLFVMRVIHASNFLAQWNEYYNWILFYTIVGKMYLWHGRKSAGLWLLR